MAAGDVVSGQGGIGATYNFQPAAGVEVMISSAGNNSQGWFYLYNGSILSGVYSMSPGNAHDTFLIKIFINNTIYIQMEASGAGKYNGFSGIQIK